MLLFFSLQDCAKEIVAEIRNGSKQRTQDLKASRRATKSKAESSGSSSGNAAVANECTTDLANANATTKGGGATDSAVVPINPSL